MRTDYESLQDGDRITLHPRPDNPLHTKPLPARYMHGLFWSDVGEYEDGPWYSADEVGKYNVGFTQGDDHAKTI